MKISEAAAILTKASSFDKRTVGEADAIAWAEALGDIRPQDAIAAVVAHFTESSEWLTPSHITKLVRQARRTRIGDTTMIVPPHELGDYPERENAWRRALREALGDGADHAQAIAAANASQGIDDEPLAIEPPEHLRQQVKDQMREVAEKIARTKNLAEQEKQAKAERFREARARRAESLAELDKEGDTA